MKKSGFTLAEVLITLGIIGVVAALTAPALVQNAGTAKIGPTLAKVVSTLENANEQILHDEDATDLGKIAETSEEYCELLSKYISGSSYDTTNKEFFNPSAKYYNNQPFSDLENQLLSAGILFKFSDNIDLLMFITNYGYYAKGSFKGTYGNMYVDINGLKTKPNVLGKDIFVFVLDRSGQIIPEGSKTYAWMRDVDVDVWTNSSGTSACNETKVGNGMGCAGSIFENNLKVIYQ